VHDALARRWRGQTGRLEVWYATLSDPETGLGCWIHHETVAPTSGDAFSHGWTAVFRPGRAPTLDRFGPVPASPASVGDATIDTDGATLESPELRGTAGTTEWNLRWVEGEPPTLPLFTFPAWAWRREVLPAAHVVVVPSAPFTGSIGVDGEAYQLSGDTRGALARIYGHGNAERWGWLHADLGHGDVLEIVSAVSRRPGMSRLAPLAFVQLRLGGHDWPRDPLLAAALFRTELALPTWRVHGTLGRWRLRAEITIPRDQSVHVDYRDPDGAPATCTNSERADAEIVLEHRGARWREVRRWELRGTAHAEIGYRDTASGRVTRTA
jgi:hypothetical protein